VALERLAKSTLMDNVGVIINQSSMAGIQGFNRPYSKSEAFTVQRPQLQPLTHNSGHLLELEGSSVQSERLLAG